MSELELYLLLVNIGIEQLLGIAISSALLSACALLAMLAARGQSASARFCVWQAASGAIVLCAVILAVLPGVPLQTTSVETPAVSAMNQDNDSLAQGIAPPRAMPNEGSQVAIPEVETTKLQESYEEPLRISTMASATEVPDSVARRSERASIADWWTSLPGVLAGIWMTVLAIKILSFGRSVAVCYAIARRASRAVPGDAADAFAAARQRIGLRQTPLLVLSDEVSIPFTLGLVQPVVVLPALAKSWPADKLEMVIGHELAHIERRDLLWHWIGKSAVCIAWFNPLVCLMARRGVLERERACDDRVIAAGIKAVEYGNCLVEIAAAMSGRTTALAAGVSMAEPPLKQRLTRILSTTTDRRRVTPGFHRFLALVSLALAAVLGIVRPLATAPAAPPNPATEEAGDAQPTNETDDRDDTTSGGSAIELSKPVTGTVTDVDGNPITGARVVVRLIDYGTDSRRPQRPVTFIKRWQTETDAAGKYSIDASEVGKQPARYCFGAESVDKEGFAQGSGGYWPTVEEVSSGESIGATTLMRGREVVGRIVSAEGRPIAGVVRATARLESGQLWTDRGTEIPESGQIQLYVPANAAAELVVYAEDHAPRRISVSQETSDFGTTALSRGTRVLGRLVGLDNKGVAGGIVKLDSANERHSFTRVARTDETGAFALGPAEGECRLYVTEGDYMVDQLGTEPITGVDPPPVTPIVIELPSEPGTRDVTLRVAQTFAITGTAHWNDGEPVKDFEVTGGVMVANTGIELSFATTDASGKYRIELPRDVEEVYLSGIGAYRDDGVWYMAHGAAPPPAEGRSQIITISKLAADVAGVDWELKAYRESPTRTAAEQRAVDAFAKLEQEKRAVSEQLVAAEAPADKERPDPRNVMATKYLHFEQEYRGDEHAVKAIVEVLMAANSVADPDSVVAKARVEMVERLIEHYLGHEDLADTFRHLNAGPEVSRADRLLQLAAGRSPHAAIRAAALLTRAERAKQQLRYAQQLPELEQFVASMKSSEPLGAPANYAEVMQHKLDALKAIDQSKLREQAGHWLDAIAKEYASEPIPNLEGHTFGADAEALRFAIDRVIIGAEAPPFEAEDIAGKLFRLSDHRGKMVALSFKQDIFDSAEHLPRRRSRVTSDDKPNVVVVTIVATPSKAKFLESAKALGYEGTLIWEPLHGPYQSRWGIDRFPTSFLVDAAGMLRSTN